MSSFRLSQSHPWSEEDVGGFALAVMISSVTFALVYWWLTPAIDLRYESPYMSPVGVGALMMVGLILLNASPIKYLPGFFQYLICAGAVGFLSRNADGGLGHGLDWFSLSLRGIVGGMMIFLGLRVHWWFLWDHPSRRPVAERVLSSIFYTTIYPLGWALGAAWLIGVGVQTPTTEIVRTDSGHLLETIPRNPLLDA